MKNKNNNNSKFQKTFQPLLDYKLWLPTYRTCFAMNCFHRFVIGEELVRWVWFGYEYSTECQYCLDFVK